ncbi:hypothetical protein BGW36DRAFT_433637 [Talaromyces proteolyticus]|uniref:Uncharacterized protein n=1 Tax=Talaromyces proteolyticus TaxID=1131652 RepID=A0AAD4KHP0_9EURO|nr:uncharacterized protein BGW36DRAFT_433637 [Talaromyces proteolyticus]KAH8689634.1 hypothetical protein BGW36DRAFT_433637 [Talaromyces proteolyticus]
MDASVWHAVWQGFLVVLYYLTYPVWLLINALRALLGTLLLPFVHMAQGMLYLSLAPFRLLAKLQPLFLFLGWAVLIGGATGLLLFAVWHWAIGEDFQAVESPSILTRKSSESSKYSDSEFNLRLNKAYSKPSGSRSHHDQFDNTHHRMSKFGDIYSNWAKSADLSFGKQRALISTTILEEEDDNYDSEDYE